MKRADPALKQVLMTNAFMAEAGTRRPPMPRPQVVQDRTRYNRKRAKAAMRRGEY